MEPGQWTADGTRVTYNYYHPTIDNYAMANGDRDEERDVLSLWSIGNRPTRFRKVNILCRNETIPQCPR